MEVAITFAIVEYIRCSWSRMQSSVFTSNSNHSSGLRQPSSKRNVNSSLIAATAPSEDWSVLTSSADRRRLQNRLAQRTYRELTSCWTFSFSDPDHFHRKEPSRTGKTREKSKNFIISQFHGKYFGIFATTRELRSHEKQFPSKRQYPASWKAFSARFTNDQAYISI